jgi:ribosomal protein S5
MQVVAPEGDRPKVEEVVAVDTVAPDFDDPSLPFATVPGPRGCEAVLVVRAPQGTTLVLNDVVGNVREAAGFGGWPLHLAG